MTPTSKLSVNVFANYSSNVNAQIISGIVSGTPDEWRSNARRRSVTQNCPIELPRLRSQCRLFVHPTDLTATARIDRRQQDYSQSSDTTTSDVFSSGVSYSRGFLGGNIGAALRFFLVRHKRRKRWCHRPLRIV